MSEAKVESKFIEKDPPLGTEQQLDKKHNDYLAYLKEKLNFILATYGRRLTDADGHISELTRTADVLESKMVHKVGDDEIISKINQSAEQITIDADKVNVSGFVTFSDLSTTGNTTINGDNVTTGVIKDSQGKNSWNLATGALSITDGSINITTNSETYDVIKMNSNGWHGEYSPLQVKLINDGITKCFLLQAGGFFGYKNYDGNGNEKLMMQIVPDSSVGAYLELNDGNGRKVRLFADYNVGLQFTDANDNLTAAYPSHPTQYTSSYVTRNTTYVSAQNVRWVKLGSLVNLSGWFQPTGNVPTNSTWLLSGVPPAVQENAFAVYDQNSQSTRMVAIKNDGKIYAQPGMSTSGLSGHYMNLSITYITSDP